jgi:EmrB/QacA subfamily drug resistance transporter
MAPTAPTKHRWWILTAIALATFMTSLDNTVVNVALPSIQRDLRLSLAGLQWVVSVYILVFASLLLVGGRLADRYGQRRLFLVGLALFTGASLLAGLAGSGPTLIAGRALQGIGAALLTPTTLAIISTTFRQERDRNLAVAAWSAIAALALALGPLAGGLLSQHWHWNGIFFVNLPVGVLTLTVARLAIPESRPHAAAGRLDLPGLATSAVGLLALTYALIQGRQAGWTSPAVAGSLALAALAWTGFAVVESRTPAPMVDVTLFRSRVFTGGTVAMMLWGLGVMGVYFFTSLYLQGILGFSPTTAGLAFVPLAVLMAAGAPLAATLATRIGANRTVAAGFVLVAAGLLTVSRLGGHAGPADLMPGLMLVGVGSGLTMPLTANILAVLAPQRAGVASGILNAAREVSGLFGVTVIGAILTTRQTTAIHHGATPAQAFLAGYTAGLLAAAALVLVGAVLTLRVLDHRRTASRTRPAPTEPEPQPTVPPETVSLPTRPPSRPHAVAAVSPASTPPHPTHRTPSPRPQPVAATVDGRR